MFETIPGLQDELQEELPLREPVPHEIGAQLQEVKALLRPPAAGDLLRGEAPQDQTGKNIVWKSYFLFMGKI